MIRLDREFNYDTLMVNLQRRYPIVHIASHFEFIPGDETKSFLLLGDGSRLSLERLHSGSEVLFDGVELLTLSACNTATGGGNGRGNEVESFAELAQNLGSKSVLATLWPVYDKSTSILMELFYRLRETQPRRSKAEALQAAQVALLEGKEIHEGTLEDLFAAQRGGSQDKVNPVYFPPDRQKPFAHPFYWAPFVLIGNWK